MALSPGTRIGSYEVVAPLGAGGMGEVYRAHDAKLNRDVALKLLPAAFAMDPDRLSRFNREAQILASLNHPHIAAIYGLEQTDGLQTLVLELVDGETLGQRIRRGPVPLPEALTIARQITEALDAAHERGIVHRDLKPENIKISTDGNVKVLDFGLARPGVAPAGSGPSDSPTTIGPTQGVLLGTAPYMSPEQARGKAVDKRADIWAFGCVLYEMLTGSRAFPGDTPFDAIAAVIEREPDWAKLPKATPPRIRQLLARCLEKDPRQRLRDIADARVDLDVDAPGAAGEPVKSVAARWVPVAMVAGLLGLAAGVLWPRAITTPARATQFTFGPAAEQSLELSAAVPSPDGTRIAFVARQASGDRALWIRRLDSNQLQRVAGSEGASGAPLWSPDGRFVAFVAQGKLKKADPAGDSIVNICPMQANLGATWNADNIIVLAPVNRTVLHRVSADGGAPEPITRLDANRRENSHRFPQFLPDGRHFLFTARSDVEANNMIYVGSLDSAEIKPLLAAQSNAMYAPPGFLLFAQEGTLIAQRFNPDTLALSGERIPVATRIAHARPSSSAMFAVSADGTVLTYVSEVNRLARLTWFDRTGKAVGTIGPEMEYTEVRIAPDGKQATVVIPDSVSGNRDIWLIEFEGGSLTRLTSHPANDWWVVWAPDSRQITFATDRDGRSSIYRKRLDGDSEESLLRMPDAGIFPRDWSRDGRFQLFFTEVGAVGSGDIWALPLAGDRKPLPLLQSSFTETSAVLSPDGRWIAYDSNESGVDEIYLKPFTGAGKRRLSIGGGTSPRWRGDEVFYTTQTNDVFAVLITGTDTLVPASPPSRALRPCGTTSTARLATLAPGLTYDVAPDGQRFLLACTGADAVPSSIGVMMHWSATFK